MFPEEPDRTADVPGEFDETVAIRPSPRRRHTRAGGRGPGRALVTGGAVLAVAGCAAIVATLGSGEGDADESQPDGYPSAVAPTSQPPAGTGNPGSVSATSSAPPPGTTAPDSGNPAPRDDGSAPPTSDRPTSTATTPGQPGPPGPPSNRPGRPPRKNGTLREGDSGPAVAELQRRLAQVQMYGRKAHGVYDAEVRYAVYRYQSGYGVKGDPEGVYGPKTRRSLESRTDQG